MKDNNTDSGLAICVDNLTKIYKLYDKQSDRFIEAVGLSKKKLYHEHYALNKLSFSVRKGECVGIIGTNGAGKSTALKIITGVLNPTEGKVSVNGRVSALLELGAGFNPEFTGLENVYINGRMLGFSKEEVDKRLNDILSFADIGEFINHPVKTYSSGMFVRLAFAVAINIEPEILIVDEALSVGDVFFQSKCFHKFEEFKKQGKTILFVSHAMGTIRKYCDRAILLNKGTKIYEGEPKEVIDIYNKLLVNGNSNNQDILEAIRANESAGADGGEGKKQQHFFEDNSHELLKDKLVINPNKVEYGNKEAEITDFAIINHRGEIVTAIDKGEQFSIVIRVQFKVDISNPIIAFTIKDLKGVELTGTNTLIEDSGIESVKGGDTLTVTFKQKMWLQGNEYLLSLGCTGFRDGELTVYHRLYDVCLLTVVAEKTTVGIFDSDSVVSIDGIS